MSRCPGGSWELASSMRYSFSSEGGILILYHLSLSTNGLQCPPRKITAITVDVILISLYDATLYHGGELSGWLSTSSSCSLQSAAVVLTESARATLEQFYLFGFIKRLMQK